MAIHFSRQTIFSFTHIGGITLSVGGASNLDVYRLGEVGTTTSRSLEWVTYAVYGHDFGQYVYPKCILAKIGRAVQQECRD